MASTGITFAAGDLGYIADLNTVIAFLEAWATEVENARDGKSTLLLKINNLLDETEGLSANLIGNSKRATNFLDAVNSQDLPTLSQVNALIIGGGSPGDIAITSLNVGTINDGELVGRVGSFIVGIAKSNINVTDLNKGTATENQYLKISGGAIVGESLSSIGLYTSEVVVSNITAASGKLYLIDTTAAERTLQLPTSMADEFSFKTVDFKRTFGTTNAHLDRNGHLIEGLAEDFDFTIDGMAIEWMYNLAENNLKRIG